MGRPSLYREEYAEQAYKLCLLGATNKELAAFFGVAGSTVDLWLCTYEQFSGAIKEGREQADSNVAKSLYQRAMGFTWTETKMGKDANGNHVEVSVRRRVPPDTVACIFWLKNRTARSEHPWKDKQEHLHTGKDGESLSVIDDRELARRVALMLDKASDLPAAPIPGDDTDTVH